MRRQSLIGIDAIWQLSLGCLLMRTIAKVSNGAKIRNRYNQVPHLTQDTKLPTIYWLPKLHKRPYKLRFIANSNACTTTDLSILLTSCLTAIKNHVIKYCTTVYERNGKNYFGLLKIQAKFSIN